MVYVSNRFRVEIRDVMSSLYVKTIDNIFQGAEFSLDTTKPVPRSIIGERRTRAHQYLQGIDWHDVKHARRFLQVVSAVLTSQHLDPETKAHVRELCKQEGFMVEGSTVRLSGHVGVAVLIGADATFDREQFSLYCDRMQNTVVDDPSQAIGAAKELVEAVCKHVLQESGEPAEGDENLQKLAKNALTKLDLTVEQLPEVKRGADAMKKILGSFASTVQGMSELRNLYGTGHGRPGAPKGLKPRHAKLAVGAAITFATFVLETLEERRKRAGEALQDR